VLALTTISAVIQVFFMEEGSEPDWRVVIRYESRSRRRIDENQYILFGIGGAAEEADLILAASTPNLAPVDGEEVDDVDIRTVDVVGNLPADELNLDDLDYFEEEDED
jgi:hypothetical protein